MTKYWRRQKISVDKILAHGNYWRRQNIGADGNYWRRQNIGIDKILASTAADFSQTSLKISFVSLMALIPLHAVAKCGVASGCSAFMGGLSPPL
jgi:hypothetical protein